jgi:hypothetical protein
MNYEIKIAELAETFPTLQGAPLRPWDADKFDAWACEQWGSGLLHAARFVLAIWAVDATWRIGRFDAMNAVAAWDATHRQAFAAWCSSAWWR